MATVYKKQVPRPIPQGAKIVSRKGERYARWQDKKGRTQEAPLSKKGTHIIKIAGTYTANYRTADGRVLDVATGCRDKDAAQAKLAELIRQEELLKGGILTTAEMRASRASGEDIFAHLATYLVHLKSKGNSQRHIDDTERLATRVINECSFQRLRDIDADEVEEWLVAREEEGKAGARTRNSYLQALNGFCGWCVKSKRLAVNPVASVHRANERTDKRKKRRALSVEEMQRLLSVARVRPLAEYGRATIRRPSDEQPEDGCSRATWTKAPLTLDTLEEATQRAKESLKAAVVARLEREGRERSLVYHMALFTGLRRGELASLTLGSLDLERGYVVIEAQDEKARRGATIPLNANLLAELKRWIASEGLTCASDKLFNVPVKIFKRLNCDLAVAGIPKIDERERSLDFHALRHSFGTMLSTSGVTPRVAQAAMRHSSIELTMQLYTDPRLLDVAGAMEMLPSLSDSQPTSRKQQAG